MVKLGFIVEGSTEKIIVESPAFNSWLSQQGLALVKPVLDAKGGGNLLPKHIEPMVKRLHAAEADHIIILTDLEHESSVEAVRQRITTEFTDLIFIAVKAIEAWFLADSQAMSQWLKQDSFYEDNPEATKDLPWQRLKEVATDFKQRGTGASKPAFAKRMIQHYGFKINHAAEHTHCPSAKQFCDGLMALKK